MGACVGAAGRAAGDASNGRDARRFTLSMSCCVSNGFSMKSSARALCPLWAS
jgi:hypothetical protein